MIKFFATIGTIGIGLLLLAACNTQSQDSNLQFTFSGINFPLTQNFEVIKVQEDSLPYSSYGLGIRYGIGSMKIKDYNSSNEEQKQNEFFGFSLYEPIDVQNQTFDQWRGQQCDLKKQTFIREYFDQKNNFQLYDFENFCNPLRHMFLIDNDRIFKLMFVEDSKAYDKAWEMLKQVEFAEYKNEE
jgi:hypothetical protein